jgi:heme exporter protein C
VLGGASAEVGLVFTAITLITGSIWGRPTWGTYWDWDPRITSTTLLFILLVGYLALRRIDNETGDASQRGIRGAIVGLLLFPNVIIVHFSVDWWRSLHQTATITRLDPTIEGTMLFTLMLGLVVFGLLFTWLLVHRFRVGWLEERVGQTGLDQALVDRRAEAGVPVTGGAA